MRGCGSIQCVPSRMLLLLRQQRREVDDQRRVSQESRHTYVPSRKQQQQGTMWLRNNNGAEITAAAAAKGSAEGNCNRTIAKAGRHLGKATAVTMKSKMAKAKQARNSMCKANLPFMGLHVCLSQIERLSYLNYTLYEH